MSFDEPTPDRQRTPVYPIWIAWALGVAISFPIDFTTKTVWGLFGYLPYAATMVLFWYRFITRSRQHKQAMADWRRRMNAYYDRQFNAGWN